MSDSRAIHSLAGDRRIAHTTATVPYPYEPGMAEEFIAGRLTSGEDERFPVWAVVEERADRLIGVVGLAYRPEIESAEISYWIGVPHWGNGYATEACRAVLDHGFQTRSLASAYGAHFVRNPGSHRVMEKVGMRVEGVARRRFRKWGVLEDECFHSILREERSAAAPEEISTVSGGQPPD